MEKIFRRISVEENTVLGDYYVKLFLGGHRDTLVF
jgi:hypothetical protein